MIFDKTSVYSTRIFPGVFSCCAVEELGRDMGGLLSSTSAVVQHPCSHPHGARGPRLPAGVVPARRSADWAAEHARAPLPAGGHDILASRAPREDAAPHHPLHGGPQVF